MIFLESWSGESTDDLIALEGTHRIDSLVLAFEQALQEKAGETGLDALTEVERDVLTVEALEREVNNGGYEQFFLNSSVEFTPHLVGALTRAGCPTTADISARAVAAVGAPVDSSARAIEAVLTVPDASRSEALERCDAAYFASGEDIAGRLFEYLKRNRRAVTLAA